MISTRTVSERSSPTSPRSTRAECLRWRWSPRRTWTWWVQTLRTTAQVSLLTVQSIPGASFVKVSPHENVAETGRKCRMHLSPPTSWFIKENPCGNECAVLRIRSPWSKGPAKFNKQQTPETTTGVGGGNAPYRVANHHLSQRKKNTLDI